MRFHERALNLKWKKVKRPDKSNAIDMLCSGLVPAAGIEREAFEANFEEVPKPFTLEEREEWLKGLKDVAVSSDAFVCIKINYPSVHWAIVGLTESNLQFPFTDNVFRAARSGAKYIAAPMGSNNDHAVLDTAEKLGIVFVEQSTRLFHH